MRKAFMNLTAHFTLEELVFSSLAVRLKLDNTPSAEVIEHLKLLAMGLEQLRSRLAAPIHIDSGYRCPLLNAVVHGAVHSAHMSGYAADFVCPGFGSPLEIVRLIKNSDLIFDQCIEEGTWVHISLDPHSRREILVAHFGPEGTTYSRENATGAGPGRRSNSET
jgi:zinc D-Ala-D-Ala carboxypeptidase